MSMTRKAKAFWIGSLAPVITLWVWGFLAMDYSTALVLTGPVILVGGSVGMIARGCTSGPPMSRKAKAFWIGFYSPVIPWCVFVTVMYPVLVRSDGEWQDMAMVVAGMGPPILFGLLIAVIARSLTRNKPGPLECSKCGYSLVGLTSDKCPECGQELCARAKA